MKQVVSNHRVITKVKRDYAERSREEPLVLFRERFGFPGRETVHVHAWHGLASFRAVKLRLALSSATNLPESPKLLAKGVDQAPSENP